MGYYKKKYRRNYYNKRNYGKKYYKSDDINPMVVLYIIGGFFVLVSILSAILFVIENIEIILMIISILGIVSLLGFTAFKLAKKYFQKRKKEFEKNVIKCSKKINYIMELNNKQHFHNVEYSYSFKEKYNIKRDYYRVDPLAYMEYVLRENYDYYLNIRKLVLDNTSKYQDYLLDADVRHSMETISDQELIDYKLNKKKFLKKEAEILESLIKPPFETFQISVLLQYQSNGGRVFEEKEDIFDFNQFCEALDNVDPSRRMDYDTYKRFEATERALITDELRMLVLKEGNFRCAICGATAEDGVRLEVDHIIPIAKGGTSDKSNLQVLCHRCNKGKSDNLI